MDALTHAVIGASVAQFPMSPESPRMGFSQKAVVGATAALFPDIDYVLFLLNPLDFLAYWHRAETHSIVLAPLWALLLTLAWRLAKSMKTHGLELYWINLAVLLSHIILDSFTMYGTQWLAPFSDHKISLDLLFVVDAYFTFCAMIVLLILYVYRESSLRWLVFLFPVAYLLLVYQIKQQVYQEAVQADRQVDRNDTISLLPQPFSPLYWQLIRRNNDETHQAYLRLTDDPVASRISVLFGKPSQQAHYRLPDQLQWRHFPLFPENPDWRPLAKEVWHHESFSAFQDFAEFPVFYQFENKNQHCCVWFSDLRYHWPNEIPQFRYGMCQPGNQDWILYRKRYFSHDAVQIVGAVAKPWPK